jgi:hypothetical protein
MKLSDLQHILIHLDIPFMFKVEDNKIIFMVYSKKTEQVVCVLYFTLDGERIEDIV